MNFEIKLTKEKLSQDLDNFINHFNQKDFLLNLARYRKEEYFTKSIHGHFNFEMKTYTKIVADNDFGQKIRQAISKMDENINILVHEFTTIKDKYENFFEKSYFIDYKKLNITYTNENGEKTSEEFKEKAVMYSILNMEELKKIKKEAITYGQYTNFIDLFFEKMFTETAFFNPRKVKILKEQLKKNMEKDFIYSFKTYFQNDMDVNPYYRAKVENGEVVGEFTDKASGTIKKIFFDIHAKKNNITNITQLDIDNVTESFQFHYRKDNDANKKIVNRYFLSELLLKSSKILSNKVKKENKILDIVINHINLKYDEYLNGYIKKFPKSFTEGVVEYVIKEKSNNMRIIVDKLKIENDFHTSIENTDNYIANEIAKIKL